MIRILLALIFALSFPTLPGLYAQAKSVDELDLEYGLPRLISEAEKKKALQKKRSKVLTQSVARKVTRIVEAFDEAGTAEDEKALILKSETSVSYTHLTLPTKA